MAYETTVLLDSINQYGERLTTFEARFPRMILAELNTHRMFSRNSASSRAIPVEKQIISVLDNPYIPIYWGVNQSGMQAKEELTFEEQEIARENWLIHRDHAVLTVVSLMGGIERIKEESLQERITDLQKNTGYKFKNLPRPVHKQTINRLLEPFLWITDIITATDYSNFFALRANNEAQPEMQQLAQSMKDLYETSTPLEFQKEDWWHLPLIQVDELELSLEALKKISAGRCARVSYLTHNKVRSPEADIELCERLIKNGHLSPLEHVARPLTEKERRERLYWGNFRGWFQFRKEIPNENNYSLVIKN